MAQTGAWVCSDNRASPKGVGAGHGIDASPFNPSLPAPDYVCATAMKRDCPITRTAARRRVGGTTAI